MDLEQINEDFILVLSQHKPGVESGKEDYIISSIPIERQFPKVRERLATLCERKEDNIEEIIGFIDREIRPNTNRTKFNYCNDLDKAFSNYTVNIDEEILSIRIAYAGFRKRHDDAIISGDSYNMADDVFKLKKESAAKIETWYKAIDISLSYDQAKKTPGLVAFSHRLGGWLTWKHQATPNLKIEIATNFGYGKSSYFFVILTFKNIRIIPFSEWIDYRYAGFSELVKYSKKFHRQLYNLDDMEKLKYKKIEIENHFWDPALRYLQNAADTAVDNEVFFIERFIVAECERLIDGLERFYSASDFEFLDDFYLSNTGKYIGETKVELSGKELIDFRTGKIIDSLEFISKIMEYNSILPTEKFVSKIISLNKRFFPIVEASLEQEKKELKQVETDLDSFRQKNKVKYEKFDILKAEKEQLKEKFEKDNEYDRLLKDCQELEQQKGDYISKIRLYQNNIIRLEGYEKKYRSYISNVTLGEFKFSWSLLAKHKGFVNRVFSTFHPFNESELLRYHGKLEIGNPSSFEENIFFECVYGLIYNTKIEWTENLKPVYYEKPTLVFIGESRDIYSFELDFEVLPISILEEMEVNKNRDIEGAYWGLYNSDAEDPAYAEEIDKITDYYDNLVNEENFEDNELYEILINEKKDIFWNKHFYQAFLNKIVKDLGEFEVEYFYNHPFIFKKN